MEDGHMDRRDMLELSTIGALGLLLAPNAAGAQTRTIKEQIVGAWLLVSAIDIHADGRTVNRWGDNPKGVFIFDPSGRYAQFLARADLPKIAGGAPDKATAEEGKAILAGLVASFGTYTVDEANKTVLTRVEGGAYPNLIGLEQKRLISSLTADELKYTNPVTSFGLKAESVWRRAK
jgi:Lipocalin-like domain